MKKIGHYLKLMRWFHEVVAIIPFVSLYLVILYFEEKSEETPKTSFPNFIILCICVQLLIAAGCVLNDLMDAKIDFVNKPKKHLIERVISKRNAWITFGVLSFLTLVLSVYICVFFFYDWWWIALLVYLLSVSYDMYFKRSPLMGNILIAIITAFIPLVLLFYCSETIEALHNPKINLLIYLFSAYSFLIIVPRELSLDISDMEGDLSDNCKTLPILIGVRKSRNVVLTMLALNSLLTVVLAFIFPYLAITLSFIALGHFYYIFLIIRCEKRIDYIRAGRFIWLVFILGLIGFTISTVV